jgi:two-component system, OmpR family, sensor histidine kinase BaeS
MRRSFALRLAVAFAVVGIGAATLTAVLVNAAFDDRFTGYLDARQSQRVDVLVDALAESYRRGGVWDQHELHQIASVALMDGGTVTMHDVDGRPLWSAEAGPGAELHRQMMGTGPLGPSREVPVLVDGTVVGVASVALPLPGLLPADLTFRSSVNRLLVLAGGLSGVLALLAGVLIARRATAPSRQLTAAARDLAAGDRSRRVPTGRTDEFGDMAEAFNRMADTVDAEDRLRRGFAADVAHELRTPLMILRGEIEAMQDGMVAPTADALDSLREETLRLGRLVDDLQTLAHADAAAFSLDRQAVDLASLAADAAADTTAAFDEAGVTLRVEVPASVPARADPVRIRQIIGNLLTNAAKFTPAGGHATLRVSGDDRESVIEVTNSGPPLSPAEMERVFERFYRGQDARAGGSGIGLAVVRQLAAAHGGAVTARSATAGTVFTVRLPRSVAEVPEGTVPALGLSR